LGDDTQKTEQNPAHGYAKGANYTAVLEVEDPEGKSQLDISLNLILQ
jgi:PKD repeat protein